MIIGKNSPYFDKRRAKRGAFIGSITSVIEECYVPYTRLKIRYTVSSKSTCEIVFENVRTKVKRKRKLWADGKEHYVSMILPEKGMYLIYLSNPKRDYVEYEIKIFSG